MTDVTADRPTDARSGPRPPRLTTDRRTEAGRDRLYVHGPGGETVGYRDLLSGADEADTLLHLAVVGTLADSWCREHGWRGPVSALSASMAPARKWDDLSQNLPGAATRAKAADLASAREAGSSTGSGTGTVTGDGAGVDADPTPWLLGAEGEEHVGAVLAEVTRAHPAWQAFHAVPVGTRGSDIDHVVIGPGGVFTLNTKRHAGSKVYVNRDGYFVNGSPTPYVRNSRHEAERAARLLSAATGTRLHVTGVIVPVGARRLDVRVPPDGVFVVPSEQLHAWLRSTGSILPVDVLARVWEAARRSTTWSG